jgi:hypothetical protein
VGIWNGRVIPQLAQNVIKCLGGDVAWRHAILFAAGIIKAIGKSRIESQKNLPNSISNKGFEALRKST